jgi:hypothetical protein
MNFCLCFVVVYSASHDGLCAIRQDSDILRHSRYVFHIRSFALEMCDFLFEKKKKKVLVRVS